MSEFTLYYVGDDGHGYDEEEHVNFIVARSPSEAFAMWRISAWIANGETVPTDDRTVAVYVVPAVTDKCEILDWPHSTRSSYTLDYDDLTTLAVFAEFELSLKGKDDANIPPA